MGVPVSGSHASSGGSPCRRRIRLTVRSATPITPAMNAEPRRASRRASPAPNSPTAPVAEYS
jgi:hypothetical protein